MSPAGYDSEGTIGRETRMAEVFNRRPSSDVMLPSSRTAAALQSAATSPGRAGMMANDRSFGSLRECSREF